MSQSALADILRQALAPRPNESLCVGFSGGPDSSALLHALANLPEARVRGLRAVHIDHGLHADSHRWAHHCQTICDRLDVPLDIQRVEVDTQSGTGPEAAARNARYAVFAAQLQAGESLLTAHHRDDQVETVLLKLLRGAGPEGLGGMRERRPFASGWLWRPLLDTPREVLADYLHDHGIESIQDPSNQSTRYARNFLRLDILPQLTAHWPKARRAINHSARLNRQTADYIHLRSREILATLQHPDNSSLDAQGWLDLHPALRGPALEQWLHAQGLTAPTQAQREQLQQQIGHASGGRVPLIRWPGAAVHVWRGRLHAHTPLPEAPKDWNASWHGEVLHLPAGGGTLQLMATDTAQSHPVPALQVRLGETGIHFRPIGDRHTRALRDLFQLAGIPPWHRRRCPAIYTADGTLLAIADLWRTEAGEALFQNLKVQPAWKMDHRDCVHPPPELAFPP